MDSDGEATAFVLMHLTASTINSDTHHASLAQVESRGRRPGHRSLTSQSRTRHVTRGVACDMVMALPLQDPVNKIQRMIKEPLGKAVEAKRY